MVKSFRTNLLNWLQTKVYLKTETDTLLKSKSDTTHNHDSRYYTESEMDTKLNNKANTSHTHDDRYYTESEVDTKLNTKANSSHAHDDRYYTEDEVDAKLDSLVGFEARVVTELPSTGELGVMYLVLDSEAEQGNIYNEYIFVGDGFELIGSTETKLVVDSELSGSSINPVQNKVIVTALNSKSDTTHTHSTVTTSNDGFMTSTDKTKLDSVEDGANKIIVDSELNSTSTNPVMNKVVYEKLGDIETVLDSIVGV